MAEVRGEQMTQKDARRNTTLTWEMFAICVVGAVIQFVIWAVQLTGPPSLYDLGQVFFWRLVLTVLFSILATLIITRLSGNRVGWLMMLIAFHADNQVRQQGKRLAGIEYNRLLMIFYARCSKKEYPIC